MLPSASVVPGGVSRPSRPPAAALRPRPAFRADVQGLRGVAVLLVVLYHVGVTQLHGGFVGVDLFFVLSGFLITGLLVREIERTGRVSLPGFYAKRARRLLPASLLVLATTLAVGSVVLLPGERWTLAHSAASVSLYASNLYFAQQTVDYFSQGTLPSPVLHTWSLAVEEQFYLVWPALVWLGMRKGRRTLVVAMAVVAALSFALCALLTPIAQPWAFYGSPARAWEFAVGGLAGLVPVAWTARRARLSALLAIVGLVATGVSAASYSSLTSFPGIAATVPVLGTAAVLIATTGRPGSWVARGLSLRPLVRLGDWSYSLYLWHWPVLIYAEALWGRLSLPAGLAAATVSLGLSAATFRWVENPLRFHPTLAARPARSLVFAAAVAVLGLGLSAIVVAQVHFFGNETLPAAVVQAEQQSAPIYRDGCHASFEQVDAPTCSYGPAGAPALVLFGDSHAAHWWTAAERVARARGWRLVSLTKSACPVADVPLSNPLLHRRYTECETWRRSMIARIRTLRPRIVLLASSDGYLEDGRISEDAWAEGMRRSLNALSASGAPLYVLEDMPAPGFDLPTCVARFARWPRLGSSSCRYRSDVSPARALDRQAARHLPSVRWIDLRSSVCTTAACPPFVGGVIPYRDYQHLSDAFSGRLAPALAQAIR